MQSGSIRRVRNGCLVVDNVKLLHSPGTEAILDAKLGVYALATITFTSYLYYVISVVSEICKHLNINALTLSREQREKKQ